jgi:hypothetical protein
MTEFIVHIGFPKAASTWLQSTIFSGADERILPLKNNEFRPGDYQKTGQDLFGQTLFCNENIIDPFEFDAAAATDKIKSLLPENSASYICLSNEGWSGSPYSSGIYSKEILQRIQATLPSAKILIVIREQIDSLFSAYSDLLCRNGSLFSLENIFQKRMFYHWPLLYGSYYRYHNIVNAYVNAFGKKNVLVLPFEILIKDGPESFSDEIYKFLNIDAKKHFDPINNNNKNSTNKEHYYIIRRNRWINIIAKPSIFNGYMGMGKTQIREFILNALSQTVSKQNLETQIAKDKQYISSQIGKTVAESNLILQKYTDYDLQKYGYLFP